MGDQTFDRLLEIDRLSVLASWYRSWAKLAGNQDERQKRIALAELSERRVRELKDAKL